MTLAEESFLEKWILSMDERGQPPQVSTVHATANLILANRDSTVTPPTVDIN